jgi:cytoskeleton protein RodZ
MVKLDSQSSREDARTLPFALGDELRAERATKGKTLLDVQRDLRIQATYLAAIEDGDVAAFPNPSFLPGYVRSYARYLSLDPVDVYARFCAETGFRYSSSGASSGPLSGAKAGPRGQSRKAASAGFQPKFPLVEPRRSLLSGLRVSAIGSLLVLVLLVGGLGYGGWTILQNIQRVQFAPVEDLPVAQADVGAIETPAVEPEIDAELADLASPVTATKLSELYRQQELAVPILQPRDGPIAAIDPDAMSPLLIHLPDQIDPAKLALATPSETDKLATPIVVAPLIEAIYAAAAEAGPGETAATPGTEAPISIVVERAAWVRIYQENGTILFERILEKGESYTLPRGIEAPLIWAGNSGSVYVEVGSELRGPIGRKTLAVRDISLTPESLIAQFPKVEVIPEVITQRSAPMGVDGPAVAIQ